MSVVVLALVAGRSSAGFAAEPSDALLEELQFLKEETVVTAVRHEQPISQAPSNVYVITDDDIRHSGATDIPTVLRSIPGIEVMQTTAAEYNVSARGDNQLTANKMLVMVDGRSIYVDQQGLVFWKAIPVTLPEIKRIEVLKGPASVVYGFNAFDGVVNIITKSPEEMKGTTVQIAGGEFGTWTNSAIHAGTQGKLGYRLSVGEDQNQQWRNRDGLAFRSYKFNVQTEYALPRDSRVRLSGGLVDVNRFDGPLFNLQRVSTPFTQGYADVVYERPNFFIRGWWMENDITSVLIIHPLLDQFIRETNQFGGPSVSFLANTYNMETQHTVEFGAANLLTYGLNYRHNTLSGTGISSYGREDRLGIYVQDEWRATHAMSMVAGVRYDLHTRIAGTISPRVALLYNLTPNHTLRLSASVAYRPPTLFESTLSVRFVPTLPPPFPSPPPFPLVGSDSLGPEQIVSYEAGYQGWWWKHRLRVRAALFFNHLSDLINFRTIGTTRTFVNGGDADIYGGEAGVEFLVTRWLSGLANVSYQKIGQTFTSVARRGAPDLKANVGLRAEWDNGLNGEALVHYVSGATYPIVEFFPAFAPFGATVPNPRVDSYTYLNLRFGYRFWREKAEVAVSAFNALNDKHKEYPLGDVIGSRVMGWLTLKF